MIQDKIPGREVPPQAAPAAPAEQPDAAAARPSAPPPFRKRPEQRRKVCRLCAEQVEHVDYKQFQLLRSFTMESGKILSSRISGTCARHQRQIARAVKRNRNLSMLPYVAK